MYSGKFLQVFHRIFVEVSINTKPVAAAVVRSALNYSGFTKVAETRSPEVRALIKRQLTGWSYTLWSVYTRRKQDRWLAVRSLELRYDYVLFK